MDERIIEIFKPIFENNTALKRLMCGDSDFLDDKSFEYLCENDYIIEVLNNENAFTMNDEKPCMILLDINEGFLGDESVSVDLVCRHDKMYMPGNKLRYFEIISEITGELHGKAEFGDGLLEFSALKINPMDDYLFTVTTIFNEEDPEDIDYSEPEIIRFYKNQLFDHLREVFETEDVRSNLYIDGVSGQDMSLEELIENRYLRITPSLEADFEQKNQFALMGLNNVTDLELGFDLFASSGESVKEDREENLMNLINEISEIITSQPGVVLDGKQIDEIEDGISTAMLRFIMGASDDEVANNERKSKYNIRVFVDTDILQIIPDAEIEVGTQDCGIEIDLLDAPFRLTILNDEILDFRFCMRHTLGADDDYPDFTLKMRDEYDDPELEFNSDFDDESQEKLIAFFRMAYNLYALLERLDVIDEFSSMDIEKEGILICEVDGEIQTMFVSGEERPELPCNQMGDVVMCRPYVDEMNDVLGEALDSGYFNEHGLSLNGLIEAGENGDFGAIDMLINLYTEGDSIYDEEQEDFVYVDSNLEKEIYWNLKGAEHGMSTAMFNLGLYHAKGYGVERDFAKAAEWMRKADEYGDEDAYIFAEEYENMAEWLEKAEKGDHKAQGQAALEYMSLGGLLKRCGGEADYREALKWAELAQGKDNGEAYFVFGLAYEHGRGVESDMYEATEYFRKGAEMGHMICINNYGLSYMLGEGVPRNREKAFELFMKSAEMGYVMAMNNVGYCYLQADGVEEDLEKALEWFEKSLEIQYDDEIEDKVAMIRMMMEMDLDD